MNEEILSNARFIAALDRRWNKGGEHMSHDEQTDYIDAAGSLAAMVLEAARNIDEQVKALFAATLRERGADLAADRLELLDADQAWDAYFGPVTDQIEETLQ